MCRGGAYTPVGEPRQQNIPFLSVLFIDLGQMSCIFGHLTLIFFAIYYIIKMYYAMK